MKTHIRCFVAAMVLAGAFAAGAANAAEGGGTVTWAADAPSGPSVPVDIGIKAAATQANATANAEKAKKEKGECEAATSNAKTNPNTANLQAMTDKCKGSDYTTSSPQGNGQLLKAATDMPDSAQSAMMASQQTMAQTFSSANPIQDTSGFQKVADAAPVKTLVTKNIGGADTLSYFDDKPDAMGTLTNKVGVAYNTVDSGNNNRMVNTSGEFGYLTTGNLATQVKTTAIAGVAPVAGSKAASLTPQAVKAANDAKAQATGIPSTGNAQVDKMLKDVVTDSGGLRQLTAADVTKYTGLKGKQAQNLATILNTYAQGKTEGTPFNQYLKDNNIKISDADVQLAVTKSGLESSLGMDTTSVTKDGRLDQGIFNHFSPGEIKRVSQKYDFPYSYDEIMADPAKQAQFALLQTHDLNVLADQKMSAAGLTYEGTGLTQAQVAYSLNTFGPAKDVNKIVAAWAAGPVAGHTDFIANWNNNVKDWATIATNGVNAINNGGSTVSVADFIKTTTGITSPIISNPAGAVVAALGGNNSAAGGIINGVLGGSGFGGSGSSGGGGLGGILSSVLGGGGGGSSGSSGSSSGYSGGQYAGTETTDSNPTGYQLIKENKVASVCGEDLPTAEDAMMLMIARCKALRDEVQ